MIESRPGPSSPSTMKHIDAESIIKSLSLKIYLLQDIKVSSVFS